MILCRKNGQLGNRLMVYAHIMAAARERGWTLFNPTFAEYSDDFEGPRGHLASCSEVLPESQSIAPWKRTAACILLRVMYQLGKPCRFLSGGRLGYLRARNAAHVDLGKALPEIEARSTQVLLLQGYHFRNADWARAQAPWLRTFFRPLARHRDIAEPVIAGLRAQVDVVVGVHIRHGDYALHLNGRFFYSVEQYLSLMRHMVQLLAPQRVGFLVCSNAQHGAADFAEFTMARGPGGVISDLHALSLCDYVLGPPSSYSSWAAFAGNTRLLRVEDPSAAFSLDDFTVQEAPQTAH